MREPRAATLSSARGRHLVGRLVPGAALMLGLFVLTLFGCVTVLRPDTPAAPAPAESRLGARTNAEIGGVRKSRITGENEVVDDEDELRARAARDLGCSAAGLRVAPLTAAEDPSDDPSGVRAGPLEPVPLGWAAGVSGCGKTAVYKFAGQAGWTRQ